MDLGQRTLYLLIVGCEAAFWIVLFAGLAARYVLRWRRTGAILLLCVPLIDLGLLVFTVMDLNAGARATFAHGLATAYVGYTVAFGWAMVRWADQRFAYRFGGGPPPFRAPSAGWASVKYELKLWLLCILATGIIYVLLAAMIAFVDDRSRTESLETWFRLPLFTVFFWFIFGPLWSLVFFRRAAAS
jgi:hypothetical protein